MVFEDTGFITACGLEMEKPETIHIMFAVSSELKHSCFTSALSSLSAADVLSTLILCRQGRPAYWDLSSIPGLRP